MVSSCTATCAARCAACWRSTLTGEVLRIELANQVSFLNRAALENALHAVPRGGHVLIDANSTDYIDPDVLDLLDDFRKTTAPAHGVELSLVGFKDRYPKLVDRIQFVDHSSRDVRDALTPEQVLQIFKDGNQRFRSGQRLTRDLVRQVTATSRGQTPMAVVLSCIDSRTPTELIFDMGIGDIFSIRIAGNVAREKVLGSMEYSTRGRRREAHSGARAYQLRGRAHRRRARPPGQIGRGGHRLQAHRRAAERHPGSHRSPHPHAAAG